MSADRVLRGVAAAANAVARAAIPGAAAALARRAAVELPGVAVSADDDAVRIEGPGLWMRAFGSRRRVVDPRFAGLAIWLARGGDR